MNQLLFKVEEADDLFTATCHEPELTAQAGSMQELLEVIRKLIDSRLESKPEQPRFDS
jgi:hypothetical protein